MKGSPKTRNRAPRGGKATTPAEPVSRRLPNTSASDRPSGSPSVLRIGSSRPRGFTTTRVRRERLPISMPQQAVALDVGSAPAPPTRVLQKRPDWLNYSP